MQFKKLHCNADDNKIKFKELFFGFIFIWLYHHQECSGMCKRILQAQQTLELEVEKSCHSAVALYDTYYFLVPSVPRVLDLSSWVYIHKAKFSAFRYIPDWYKAEQGRL